MEAKRDASAYKENNDMGNANDPQSREYLLKALEDTSARWKEMQALFNEKNAIIEQQAVEIRECRRKIFALQSALDMAERKLQYSKLPNRG